MTHLVKAFAFRSPLGLPAMLERLNAQGPWHWALADSDAYGDYLACRPFSDSSLLRIVEDQDGYICDIVFWSEAPDAQTRWERLTAAVREMLPARASATRVEPTANLD